MVREPGERCFEAAAGRESKWFWASYSQKPYLLTDCQQLGRRPRHRPGLPPRGTRQESASGSCVGRAESNSLKPLELPRNYTSLMIRALH
jgi:hypothetical protein